MSPSTVRVLAVGPRFAADHPRFKQILVDALEANQRFVVERRLSPKRQHEMTMRDMRIGGPFRLLGWTFRSALAIAQRGRGADVVLLVGIESLPGALLFRPLFRYQVVFDASEDYSAVAQSLRFGALRSRIVSTLLKTCSRGIDLVITSRSHLSSQYPHSRSSFLPNSSSWRIASQVPRRTETDSFGVASIGILSAERGFPQLCQAIATLCTSCANQKVKLIMPGRVDDSESETALRELVLKCHEQLEIVAPGWLPGHEVVDLVGQAHVGIVSFLPTNNNNADPMPNKLFDYWSQGLPVIATNGTGDMARWIRECGGGCLVDPSVPAEIAAALEHYALDEAERYRAGQEGLQLAAGRFALDKIQIEFVRIFEQVVEPR
jgi:glycosyltransferase involved in cell wall biosynthesis